MHYSTTFKITQITQITKFIVFMLLILWDKVIEITPVIKNYSVITKNYSVITFTNTITECL